MQPRATRAAKYVAAIITRDVKITEGVASAYATGSIMQLPAGKWSLVVGAEGRKDKSTEIQDPLTNAGLNGSNALHNVEGSVNVKEAYIETDVPLLKDLPAVKSLDINGAFREASPRPRPVRRRRPAGPFRGWLRPSRRTAALRTSRSTIRIFSASRAPTPT